MAEKVNRKKEYETLAVSICFVFRENDILMTSDFEIRNEETADDIYMD